MKRGRWGVCRKKFVKSFPTAFEIVVSQKEREAKEGRYSLVHSDRPRPRTTGTTIHDVTTDECKRNALLLSPTKLRNPSRTSTAQSSSQSGMGGTVAQSHDPLRRIEPFRKFASGEVKEIIQDVFNSLFSECDYNVETLRRDAKAASDSIKSQVKMLGYARYKIVCIVYVVENLQQGVNISSRGMIDEEHDHFAEYVMTCGGYNVTGVVYGVYTY